MLWHETAQACSLPPRWMIEINSIHSLREHGVETETGHHHNFKSPHCNFIQVELTHWIHLTNLTLMLPMPTMLPADMDKNGTWALILRLSCTAWLKEEQCEKQQAWNALIWVMIIYRLYTGRERERERLYRKCQCSMKKTHRWVVTLPANSAHWTVGVSPEEKHHDNLCGVSELQSNVLQFHKVSQQTPFVVASPLKTAI